MHTYHSRPEDLFPGRSFGYPILRQTQRFGKILHPSLQPMMFPGVGSRLQRENPGETLRDSRGALHAPPCQGWMEIERGHSHRDW